MLYLRFDNLEFSKDSVEVSSVGRFTRKNQVKDIYLVVTDGIEGRTERVREEVIYGNALHKEIS